MLLQFSSARAEVRMTTTRLGLGNFNVVREDGLSHRSQSATSVTLFRWQPTVVIFSYTKSAPDNSQLVVLFFYSKSAPATSHSQSNKVLYLLCQQDGNSFVAQVFLVSSAELHVMGKALLL